MSDHTIKIVDGRMIFVYDDELVDLLHEGTPAVCRVSHVEPHPTKGGWIADMTPAGMAVIIGDNGEWPARRLEFVEPFKTRQEALAAERRWLTKEKGL